jgi:hypothetical protein
MWQELLGMLSKFAQCQAEGVHQSTNPINDLLTKIEDMPQQPAAAWTRIVQDVQVG